MYYCNPSDSRKRLLENFTSKPTEFKHMDLVAQMENISLLTSEAAEANKKKEASEEKTQSSSS